MSRRLLVIGGGITGLAAAVELAGVGGAEVEVWEAAPRLGGKIATSPFGGLAAVDEGADAFLTRVPHAVDFARTVGLTDAELVSPTPATAMVWHDGMHAIPGGIVLGVPASVRPFVTTSLLSWRGKLRAALEPVLAATDHGDSLGALVRARFGDEVHDRLVDALVGSIYATDTDHASLALVPQLAALAEADRSLLRAARRARARASESPATAPIFAAPRAGMGALVEAAAAHAAGLGVHIRSLRPAVSIVADDSAWRVDDERFDGVVIAAPARAAGALLSSVEPAVSRQLAAFEHAGITMVRLRLDATTFAGHAVTGHSGYLVPKSRQRHVTAVSFASEKWEHLRVADNDPILRVSLGRDGLPVDDLDDDAVLAVVQRELSNHLGTTFDIEEMSITRWPEAFPQYRPHHATRVASIDAALPSTIVLAGASYRGIGIPACIADGQRAARSLATQLA